MSTGEFVGGTVRRLGVRHGQPKLRLILTKRQQKAVPSSLLNLLGYIDNLSILKAKRMSSQNLLILVSNGIPEKSTH